MSENQFDNLKIPSLKFTKLNQRYYKVYKDKHEFVQIEEASSVNEAIDKAGIEHPYAVKLVVYYLGSVVKEEFLVPAPPEEIADTEETQDSTSAPEANASETKADKNKGEEGSNNAEKDSGGKEGNPATSDTPEDKPEQ